MKEFLEKRNRILEQRRPEAMFADHDSSSEAECDSDVSFVPSHQKEEEGTDNEERILESTEDEERIFEESETGEKKKRLKRRIRQAVSKKRLRLQHARNSGQSYGQSCYTSHRLEKWSLQRYQPR